MAASLRRENYSGFKSFLKIHIMEPHQRIVEHAAGLFIRFGVRSVTMDSIAESLGISKRTIYENFSNKDELLKACIDFWTKQNEQVLKDNQARSANTFELILFSLNNAMQNLEIINPTFFSDIRKYHPQVHKSGIAVGKKKNQEFFMKILGAAIKEGFLRSDINTEIVSLGINGLSEMITYSDVFKREKHKLPEIFENMMLTYVRGLCTQKGLDALNKSFEKK